MRILWIVNIIFPFPAKKIGLKNSCFGGWLNGLANSIKDDKKVKLAIATVYSGKKILEFNDGNIVYYLIPGAPALKYDKRLEKYWKIICQSFKPDLVHIHGTEYTHGLAFKNGCPNIKTIISIQGLVYNCSSVYLANIEFGTILKNITLRDILKRDSLFQQKNKFKKRGYYERELIKKSDFIIGRTTWDYSNCKAINNDLKYFKCNETIRNSFYEAPKWNIYNIEKNSIYLSQSAYPIKGLHQLIKAVALLKQQGYNNIKLYISGPNITKYNTVKEKLKISGYGNIIRTMIKKMGLNDNVVFTGNLNENEVIERLLKSNVVVVPSIIENESNSLSEAGLLGVPVVCSYAGGIIDRIEHNKDGLLYPFAEENMLAEDLKKIFDDNIFAQNTSKNLIIKYEQILDKNNNKKNIINIYNKVLGEE